MFFLVIGRQPECNARTKYPRAASSTLVITALRTIIRLLQMNVSRILPPQTTVFLPSNLPLKNPTAGIVRTYVRTY